MPLVSYHICAYRCFLLCPLLKNPLSRRGRLTIGVKKVARKVTKNLKICPSLRFLLKLRNLLRILRRRRGWLGRNLSLFLPHAKENLPLQTPDAGNSSSQFYESLDNLDNFLQSDDFQFEGLENASSNPSFIPPNSSMSRLTSVFSDAANVEDAELVNVCKCLAFVGKSFSSEQPSDFRGISKDVSPDFLASLLSLVLITKVLS